MALTNAEKQARHRDRQEVLKRELIAFREELTRALESAEGRNVARLVRGLPDDPGEWLPELTRRLSEVKIIVCARPKELPAARRTPAGATKK
jgi:hypothetical protein